jgi:hypothetical protein
MAYSNATHDCDGKPIDIVVGSNTTAWSVWIPVTSKLLSLFYASPSLSRPMAHVLCFGIVDTSTPANLQAALAGMYDMLVNKFTLAGNCNDSLLVQS